VSFAHPLLLRSALGAWLPGRSEEELVLLTGVGGETLARIVDGSVVPEDDVAARIWAQVQ